MAGGGPAAFNRFSWETADGIERPAMVSKAAGIHLAAGRRLRLETPGGGGYGDPRTRDPELVRRDVRRGLICREAAESDYRL